MARPSSFGRDTGLQARMLLTMFLLGLVYVVFMGVLFAAGAGAITIVFFAAVLFAVQLFASDKLALRAMGAKEVSPADAPELHAMIERLCIQVKHSWRATQAPVMEAVRVPPSACSTSQSMTIWRSPMAGRLTTARSARPIRRWISCVRPDGRPAVTSRRVRSCVARGSIAYSAVIQPLPLPRSQGGPLSSSEAVQRTFVFPKETRHEPSA